MARKSVAVIFVVLLAVVPACFADHHRERATNSIDDNEEGLSLSACDDKDTSLSCQSIRIARNVFQQLMKAKSSDGIGDLKIIDGVELVRTQSLGEGGGRSLNDGTVLGKIAGYLQSHEIRVKLPDLIGKDDMNGVFSETLRSFDKQSGLVETGRKKKGDGGILLMGLMMAKTLAAIGFGGLGLLTMKALMVSALALMLSAIIGIKKLASSGDDHDGGHQVHYVQAHDHHRRRRMIEDHTNPEMPYSGWTHYVTSY